MNNKLVAWEFKYKWTRLYFGKKKTTIHTRTMVCETYERFLERVEKFLNHCGVGTMTFYKLVSYKEL